MTINKKNAFLDILAGQVNVEDFPSYFALTEYLYKCGFIEKVIGDTNYIITTPFSIMYKNECAYKIILTGYPQMMNPEYTGFNNNWPESFRDRLYMLSKKRNKK